MHAMHKDRPSRIDLPKKYCNDAIARGGTRLHALNHTTRLERKLWMGARKENTDKRIQRRAIGESKMTDEWMQREGARKWMRDLEWRSSRCDCPPVTHSAWTVL